jgi:hypothetical protein
MMAARDDGSQPTANGQRLSAWSVKKMLAKLFGAAGHEP